MKKQMSITDRRKVRAWMIMQGISQTSIKVALGHKSINQVHATLQGIRNDRRVLQYLLDNGCPAEHLNLPSDMLEAA